MSTREERRAEFDAALKAALNLRPLYAAMDEEDRVALVRRYPDPDRSLGALFKGPLIQLFDRADDLRALDHQSAER
jgi:hypothetical protein